jgi:hypothetical protein
MTNMLSVDSAAPLVDRQLEMQRTRIMTSKTRTQSDTVIIGTACLPRRWERLLRPPKRLLELLDLARSLAKRPHSNMHRLRHGGASADALPEGAELVSDLSSAIRARSKCLGSIRRYRHPARYLRRLAQLSQIQISLVKKSEHILLRDTATRLASHSWS